MRQLETERLILSEIFDHVWCIARKEDQIIVGAITVMLRKDSAEISYHTESEYQGSGYMSEALPAFSDWILRGTRLRRLQAETEKENGRSQGVLEKAGFRRTGSDGSIIYWERER